MEEKCRVNVFNIKANSKHCVLEYAIHLEEHTCENSRSDLFQRLLNRAEFVEDWTIPLQLLGSFELEDKSATVPSFTSWFAKYDNETKQKLALVRDRMETSLIAGGKITRVLQTQFLLQLLMINYLQCIKREKRQIMATFAVKEKEEIGLPEISALLTELMLTDRENDALAQIKNILIKWRKENDNEK